MTISTFVIAPEYVSFYVAGVRDFEPKTDTLNGSIAATSESVTIPSIYNYDGTTTVHVRPAADVNPTRNSDFDGVIATPARLLMISEALADIADIEVSGTSTRLQIWINHHNQPDHVVIAWSDASTE